MLLYQGLIYSSIWCIVYNLLLLVLYFVYNLLIIIIIVICLQFAGIVSVIIVLQIVAAALAFVFSDIVVRVGTGKVWV